MKVSIITPLYCAENYVEQCARSLFEQSFENIEFIFVDDASHDNSVAILERTLAEYPHQMERTKILRNESNMGVSESRNRAIEEATGHFILFVDGDDWCATNMIEELVIEQLTYDYDVVTSSFYAVDNGRKKVVDSSLIGGRKGSLRVVVSQSFDLPNRVWGILIRRKLIVQNSICFDHRITMGEDFLFLLQVLYHAERIKHISLPLYYYRANVGATSQLGYSARRSYVRAVVSARCFLSEQPDYKEFAGALRLSRFNLRRWLLLRKSRQITPRSALYRLWCYLLNGLYRLYCTTYRVR